MEGAPPPVAPKSKNFKKKLAQVKAKPDEPSDRTSCSFETFLAEYNSVADEVNTDDGRGSNSGDVTLANVNDDDDGFDDTTAMEAVMEKPEFRDGLSALTAATQGLCRVTVDDMIVSLIEFVAAVKALHVLVEDVRPFEANAMVQEANQVVSVGKNVTEMPDPLFRSVVLSALARIQTALLPREAACGDEDEDVDDATPENSAVVDAATDADVATVHADEDSAATKDDSAPVGLGEERVEEDGQVSHENGEEALATEEDTSKEKCSGASATAPPRPARSKRRRPLPARQPVLPDRQHRQTFRYTLTADILSEIIDEFSSPSGTSQLSVVSPEEEKALAQEEMEYQWVERERAVAAAAMAKMEKFGMETMEPLRVGYLHKQPKSGKRGMWKERFFVFLRGQVNYYDTRQAWVKKKNAPRGTFSTVRQDMEVVVDDSANEFKFMLKNKRTNESLMMRATSEKERAEWVNFLQNYIDEAHVFGVPLDVLARRYTDGRVVPIVVSRLSEFIVENGLEVEGVFRIAQEAGVIAKVVSRLDQDEAFNFCGIAEGGMEEDIHVAAGILKYFFRSLPSPVIPTEMYDDFVEAAYPAEAAEEKFPELLRRLPEVNLAVLSCLLDLLAKLSSAESNKMSTTSLAIVFSPNLLTSGTQRHSIMVTQAKQQTDCVECLIALAVAGKLSLN